MKLLQRNHLIHTFCGIRVHLHVHGVRLGVDVSVGVHPEAGARDKVDPGGLEVASEER